jgi:hypothetical protein
MNHFFSKTFSNEKNRFGTDLAKVINIIIFFRKDGFDVTKYNVG